MSLRSLTAKLDRWRQDRMVTSLVAHTLRVETIPLSLPNGITLKFLNILQIATAVIRFISGRCVTDRGLSPEFNSTSARIVRAGDTIATASRQGAGLHKMTSCNVVHITVRQVSCLLRITLIYLRSHLRCAHSRPPLTTTMLARDARYRLYLPGRIARRRRLVRVRPSSRLPRYLPQTRRARVRRPRAKT